MPSCRARWHPSRSISSSSFLHECLKSLNLYLTESHWSINSKLPLSKFSVFGRSGNLEAAGNFTEVGQVGFSEAEETRYSVTVLQCVIESRYTSKPLCAIEFSHPLRQLRLEPSFPLVPGWSCVYLPPCDTFSRLLPLCKHPPFQVGKLVLGR